MSCFCTEILEHHTLAGSFYPTQSVSIQELATLYLNQIVDNCPMQKLQAKSIVIQANEQEHSFRSNRTFTQYNIHDYLPPTFTSLSRTSQLPYRPKDKIYTEPNDKANPLEVNELKRKIDSHEEEKQVLRKEMERLTRRLQSKEKVIEQKDEQLKQISSRVTQLENQLREVTQRQPSLQCTRGTLHFIYYPKLHQRYEVSVQTEAIEVSPSFTPAPPTFSKKPSRLADREMHEIQEKLSKLHQVKKAPRERVPKPQDFSMKFDKIERGEAIFAKIEQKQNLIRLSNTFQRVSNLPEQRIREENIEISPIQLNQIERLIRLYMQ